jgi:hypothetical protein
MVPRTFPSTYETVNGETRMVVFFLSSVSGLTKWVDYIPVKFPMLETQDSNSYNNDGVVLVDPLSSTTNKQAWIDYIPVFVDANDTAAWRVDANGYIPVGFAVKPTLNLDFAGTKTLDPRITFSRASSATYFDADGVLQTAASGVARFDHNPLTGESLGLLVEEQRTNLCLQSEDFSTTWGNTNSSDETNVLVAPNGTLTADKLVEDASVNTHSVFQNITPTVIGTVYTLSVYAKSAGRDLQLFFGIGDISGDPHANFDLTNGTVSFTNGTITAAITDVGNGWYRCSVSATSTVTTNFGCVIGLTNSTTAARAVSYTGDGYSGIYIWGAQLEAGAFPTSYIPTVAATVTRNADVATMTGTNFSSWFRADEGSLYVDLNFYALQSFRQGVNFSNSGDTTNFMSIQTATSPAARGNVTTNGTSQAAMFPGNLTAGVDSKLCFAYRVNDFAITLNGAAVATDTSGTVPVVNQLGIGTTGAITSNGNQTIKKIAFYPSRLSNAQLQALTR